MTSNYYGGNHFTVKGHHNTGMINNNHAPEDPHVVLREMIAAVNLFRTQVPPADRAVIDQSVRAIGSGEQVEKQVFRRALGNIAGIATVVGEVGAPVIETVRKVMAAFGLQ